LKCPFAELYRKLFGSGRAPIA
jgi:hypothetical protein